MRAPHRIWPALLLLGAALTGCGTNPVTGKRELQFVSEASEISMGQQNYAPTQQSEGGDFTLDPALTPYVNEVGQKLAAVSDRKLPYEFVVLNNSVPNAWALPGGKIAVNRGLLTELKNEAELAAVLGHEIVHAAARHGAKAQERGTLLQVGLVAAQIGLATSDLSQSVANMAIQGAGVGAQLIQTKYGRDQELESDLYGMRYMQRAGYDLAGAVSLQETFVRISEATGRNQSWLEGLFASHPPSVERVEQNRRTMAELGGPGGDLGTERFMARTAEIRRMKPAYDKYDQALAAAGKKDWATARRLGSEASQLFPAEARFAQLLGDLAMAEKKPRDALPHYERAIAQDAGYFGSYLGGGIAQYQLGNKAKSEEWLKQSAKLLPTAPAAYYLGNIARERGDPRGAMQFYQAAAGSQSEYGQLAAAEFQRMDLPQNPGNYIAAGAQRDASGKVLLVLQNRSALPLASIDVTPVLIDAGGNIVSQGARQSVRINLAAGQSVMTDIGLGAMSAEQTAALRFRIDGANPAQ